MSHTFQPGDRVRLGSLSPFPKEGRIDGVVPVAIGQPSTNANHYIAWYRIELDDGDLVVLPARQLELISSKEPEVVDTFIVEITVRVNHASDPSSVADKVGAALEFLPRTHKVTNSASWRIFEAPKEQ